MREFLAGLRIIERLKLAALTGDDILPAVIAPHFVLIAPLASSRNKLDGGQRQPDYAAGAEPSPI